MSLSIKTGDFVGPVGSGKTAFLDALLGEMQRTEGQISVNKPPRVIGFVKQEALLQQGTVGDNIMWGTVQLVQQGGRGLRPQARL